MRPLLCPQITEYGYQRDPVAVRMMIDVTEKVLRKCRGLRQVRLVAAGHSACSSFLCHVHSNMFERKRNRHRLEVGKWCQALHSASYLADTNGLSQQWRRTFVFGGRWVRAMASGRVILAIGFAFCEV